MIKKILISIILVLFSYSIALGCFLPDGLNVWVVSPQGMMRGVVPGNQDVVRPDEQPTQEQMITFGNLPDVNEDFSDGVIVYDEDEQVHVLVHEGDLVGECEVLKKD